MEGEAPWPRKGLEGYTAHARLLMQCEGHQPCGQQSYLQQLDDEEELREDSKEGKEEEEARVEEEEDEEGGREHEEAEMERELLLSQ